MNKKYDYEIKKTPHTGDWLWGRFYWSVILDREEWQSARGWARNYQAAVKKIKKEIRKWEEAEHKGQILYVKGKTNGQA